MAAAPLWPYSAVILFLICKSEKSADFSDLLFHGRGRNGKRHMLLSACGRRAATWIFCMEPNCFGIIKGVQPLVCNGNDRGQRPKQGGAVGAAACRMRVPSKARSRRREPQPAASHASKVAETLPRRTRDICFANRSAA